MSPITFEGQSPWIPWNELAVTDTKPSQVEEVSSFPDTSSWPVADETFLGRLFLHPTISNSGHHQQLVDIKVGNGLKARRWLVHKALICEYSPYIDSLCGDTKDERSFQFELNQQPQVFKLFLDWLYTYEQYKSPYRYKECRHHSREWRLYAAEAYVLSVLLKCKDFQKYCLAMVREFIGSYDLREMEYIYASSSHDSPIRMFCNEWVKLRNRMDKRVWIWTKDGSIYSFVSQRQRTVRDPRLYHIDHWFRCSSLDGSCRHHPSGLPHGGKSVRLAAVPKLSRTVYKWNYNQQPWHWRDVISAVKERWLTTNIFSQTVRTDG